MGRVRTGHRTKPYLRLDVLVSSDGLCWAIYVASIYHRLNEGKPKGDSKAERFDSV